MHTHTHAHWVHVFSCASAPYSSSAAVHHWTVQRRTHFDNYHLCMHCPLRMYVVHYMYQCMTKHMYVLQYVSTDNSVACAVGCLLFYHHMLAVYLWLTVQWCLPVCTCCRVSLPLLAELCSCVDCTISHRLANRIVWSSKGVRYVHMLHIVPFMCWQCAGLLQWVCRVVVMNVRTYQSALLWALILLLPVN